MTATRNLYPTPSTAMRTYVRTKKKDFAVQAYVGRPNILMNVTPASKGLPDSYSTTQSWAGRF
jgi:hypothetical protein